MECAGEGVNLIYLSLILLSFCYGRPPWAAPLNLKGMSSPFATFAHLGIFGRGPSYCLGRPIRIFDLAGSILLFIEFARVKLLLVAGLLHDLRPRSCFVTPMVDACWCGLCGGVGSTCPISISKETVASMLSDLLDRLHLRLRRGDLIIRHFLRRSIREGPEKSSRGGVNLTSFFAYDHCVPRKDRKEDDMLVDCTVKYALSSHGLPCRRGKVKITGGLPTKVGMTRLSQVGGRDGLGLDKAHLAWRGEDCGWSIREDGHDSPIVHVMVAGMDSATGHGAPHRGEVRTASGLPAKDGSPRSGVMKSPKTEQGSLGAGAIVEPLDLFPSLELLSNLSSYWYPWDFELGA
ncbi:hypothetical protein CRG98_012106 [Punica granatum]|uniref:Uncharacterized protein n=1 Tax=Punica granatum TaxID=22663 RepID=A0A2I0KGA1_PUNGR|nr:hypothetical protein CRG98_012106 [Punica granatum]